MAASYYNKRVDEAVDGDVKWNELEGEDLRKFIVALCDQAGCEVAETNAVARILQVPDLS